MSELINPEYKLREGSTKPFTIVCQDLVSRVATVVNLTGSTKVTLHLKPGNGDAEVTKNSVDDSSVIAFGTLTAGEVVVTPSFLTLAQSPYKAFLRVIDAAANELDFPSDTTFKITVFDDFS